MAPGSHALRGNLYHLFCQGTRFARTLTCTGALTASVGQVGPLFGGAERGIETMLFAIALDNPASPIEIV